MQNLDEETLSSLYNILCTSRRRRAIQVLHQSEAPVIAVRDLSREIAAAEHMVPLSHATGEPYRNVYNALSQTHLPALAAVDIVIYDSKRQTVSPGSRLTVAVLLAEITRSTVEILYSES